MGTKNTNLKGIDNKELKVNSSEVNFEPIVSVIKKSVIGFEAKCLEYKVGEIQDEKLIESDRNYREKSIESFKSLYNKNKELLIFLDIDISIIDKYIGSGILLNVVNQFGIEPRNIVLEIVESKIDDIEAMQKFINYYRSRGFLIGLKDLGSGFSNLDRISYVEPDIIKINSSITKEISFDYYKQEIFKSLVNLSKKIGSLIVVENIENNSEAMVVMELGADMLQGSVFSEPLPVQSIEIQKIEKKIYKTATEFKDYMYEGIKAKETSHKDYDAIITRILDKLSSSKEEGFTDIIEKAIIDYSILECIYILDKNGTQISDTVTKYKNIGSHKALIFQPAKKGSDHSLKKYYYFLSNMNLNKYITEPYVSLATGNLCITISATFENKEGKDFILCIDFNPDYINM